MSNEQNNSPSKPAAPARLGGRATAVFVAFFALAVAVIVGYPYYKTYIAPWRETILTVGDTSFDMRYLVKRLRLGMPDGPGVDKFAAATEVLQDIQKRAIISREALKQNINVSEQEVDQEVKRRVEASATGRGEFGELYEAMLRGLRLTEKEFRERVMSDLLREKLQQKFLSELATGAEQIRVLIIVTKTSEQAERIRARLREGEDFSQLAKAESIDLKSSRNGGDIGWLPKGVDDLVTTGQVHSRGILTKTQAEAETIRQRILAGEDFTKLASLNSLDDASRARGGYLGWVTVDYKTGRQFAAEAFDLEPGDVSEPIDTYEGFWVIKLIEKSPEGKLIDDIAFGLPVGQVSPPLYTDRGVYLITVAGREAKRPLSEEHLGVLGKKLMDDWLKDTVSQGSSEGWITWNWGSKTFGWAMSHLD